MMRSPSLLLPLAALVFAPATAHGWGLLVPADGACARVSSYEALLTPSAAGVDTRVTLELEGVDPHDVEPMLLLPVEGLPPAVVLDAVPQQVDRIPAGEALDLLVGLAADRGDPSFLALAGSDLYRVQLVGANGPARRIEIAGSRALVEDPGTLHISHPLRPGQTWCGPAGRVTVEVALPGLSGRAWAGAFAPYHDLAVDKQPDGRLTARFEAQSFWPAFDFHLYPIAAGGPVGAALMAWREPACDAPADDGSFALVAASSGVGGREVLPKDLVLVLDTSGSMAGEKIVQARRAASYVLEHLNPGDRFNVLDFDDDVRPLFQGLAEVGPETLGQAMAFAGELSAGGSTNIHDALQAAKMSLPGGGDGRPALVVFVTDGQATEGITDRDQIIASLHTNAIGPRIFPFGVGYDVNTFLLDGLAAGHGGVSSYIHPGEDIATALAGFYDRVRTPTMTGLALRTDAVQTFDVLPRTLPDLFEGGQAAVLGRYTDAPAGALTLVGDMDGDGVGDRVLPDGRLVRSDTRHAWIPRLWAARMVADLVALDRREPGDEDVVERIRTLARQYGIATPFTSFFRDDQGNVRDAYERPTDQESGEQSVHDSDAVNAMNANDNAARYANDGALAGLLRHLDDRTFLMEDGYWVDTSVDAEAAVVDLHYASPTFARFLAHDPSLGRFLSVARNVTFRHACRVFRVTDVREQVEPEPDPEAPEAPAPPAETEEAPAELLPGRAGAPEWMEPAGDAEAPEAPEEPWLPEPEPEEPAADAEADGLEDDEDGGARALCAVADPGALPGPWAFALLLLVLGRGIVRGRWTGSASRRCTPASAPSSSVGRPRS